MEVETEHDGIGRTNGVSALRGEGGVGGGGVVAFSGAMGYRKGGGSCSVSTKEEIVNPLPQTVLVLEGDQSSGVFPVQLGAKSLSQAQFDTLVAFVCQAD